MKIVWIIGMAALATSLSACDRTEEAAKESVAVSHPEEESDTMATPMMDDTTGDITTDNDTDMNALPEDSAETPAPAES
ncbi:hypothetical protein D6851_14345 [Altericroceibacterium spongiae]|uniref:Uncharacterized protein n=1 Tax=Altericroceibacterium spongiae TaxID=2320269 RepID=A0A420EE10_9SPHN|nr:hypothetical protein [Altericroceibacterium spongiae]RKF18969.1 hypothetical protein D6851_14345 [Altericroceibacterium spongiae]